MNEEMILVLIRGDFVIILVGLFIATKRGNIDRAEDLGLQKTNSMTHFFFWLSGFQEISSRHWNGLFFK